MLKNLSILMLAVVTQQVYAQGSESGNPASQITIPGYKAPSDEPASNKMQNGVSPQPLNINPDSPAPTPAITTIKTVPESSTPSTPARYAPPPKIVPIPDNAATPGTIPAATVTPAVTPVPATVTPATTAVPAAVDPKTSVSPAAVTPASVNTIPAANVTTVVKPQPVPPVGASSTPVPMPSSNTAKPSPLGIPAGATAPSPAVQSPFTSNLENLDASFSYLLNCTPTSVTKNNSSIQILGWVNDKCHTRITTESKMAGAVNAECLFSKSTIENLSSAVNQYKATKSPSALQALVKAIQTYMGECQMKIHGKEKRPGM